MPDKYPTRGNLSPEDEEFWLTTIRETTHQDLVRPWGSEPMWESERYRTPTQKAFAAFWAFVKRHKTLSSISLMITVMTPFVGLPLILALVLMVMFHEAGHMYVLWRKGLPFTAPVFIPFVGAAIAVPKMGGYWDEAMVGLGGPLLGTVTTLVAMLVGVATDSDFLLLCGVVGAWINLFNLIPVAPIDGGRILRGVTRWAAPLGLLLMGWWAVKTLSSLLGVIALLLIKSVWRDFWGADPRPKLSGAQKWMLVSAYTLLVVILVSIFFGDRILTALGA